MAMIRDTPAQTRQARASQNTWETVQNGVFETVSDAPEFFSPEPSGPQVMILRVRLLGVLMALAVATTLLAYGQLEWRLAEARPELSDLRGRIVLRDGTVMAESFEPRRNDPSVSNKERETRQARRYPQGSLAGQVMGFYSAASMKGLEGLETFAENRLKAGQDVVLTLDPVMQATAEAQLEQMILDQNAEAGSVVALEAGTNRILAMANYPRFNPERRDGYDGTQWLNRATRVQYEPGSTMKALTAAILVNEGAARPETTVDAPMWRNVSGHIVNDAIKHKPLLTLQEVLRYSSNVGISRLAETRIPMQTLHTYLTDFGIGQPMKLEGASPVRGLLRNWQSWRPIDHTTVTFGQGVSTTTLQLAVAYSVLTNDGVLIAPRLIEGTPAQMTRRVLSVQAAQTTRAMLKNVVEEGLPYTAVIPGYCIGGKTGTAQVAINGRYSSDVFGALFAGFFPCDKPRVTMVVEVYHPKKQIHGSQVAAPTFRRIAEEILAHWGVMPGAVKEPTR
jgi:cell division protein FtsI (penicillin-binding protein 3)